MIPFVRACSFFFKILQFAWPCPLSIKQLFRLEIIDHLSFTLLSGAVCVLEECVVQCVSVTFMVGSLSVGSLPGLLSFPL